MNTVQLDIFVAREERNAGITKAVTHAEGEVDKWADRAYKMLLQFLGNHNGPFMVEEVRSYAALIDFPLPPSARAWGGVIVRAQNSGLVERAGYQPTRNIKAHRTPAALWRQTKRK